jgi:malonyl-CoA/methylmalonyl-CoA synthetase
MSNKTRESFVEGWFRSGDLGYQDPKDGGRLNLVGRAKERKAPLSNNKSELAEK